MKKYTCFADRFPNRNYSTSLEVIAASLSSDKKVFKGIWGVICRDHESFDKLTSAEKEELVKKIESEIDKADPYEIHKAQFLWKIYRTFKNYMKEINKPLSEEQAKSMENSIKNAIKVEQGRTFTDLQLMGLGTGAVALGAGTYALSKHAKDQQSSHESYKGFASKFPNRNFKTSLEDSSQNDKMPSFWFGPPLSTPEQVTGAIANICYLSGLVLMFKGEIDKAKLEKAIRENTRIPHGSVEEARRRIHEVRKLENGSWLVGVIFGLAYLALRWQNWNDLKKEKEKKKRLSK